MTDDKNNQDKILYHTLSVEETFKRLNAVENGLSDDEVQKRLSLYGKNELKEGQKRTVFKMFIDQFKNLMVIILLIAAVISGLLWEIADSAIILFVIVLNAVLGVIQENKAEKALAALKKMASPYAKVKRNGDFKLVKTSELVPGDLVLLEAGDYVPADMRLFQSVNLKIEEAALTGESVPVEKTTDVIPQDDVVLGDRKNMAYLGSSVTYGRGTGVVTVTGMNTEVGKIAGYITKDEAEETPLQKKLAEMSKFLSVGIIAIAVIIFLAGVIQGRDYFEMFLTAVSLAVAAIPEGLPAVVTIVLALGVQRMARKNAIIRRLPAVETLGTTEIICSDKTGTLTQNKMTVKKVFINDNLLDSQQIKCEDPGLTELLKIIVLCNDSKIKREKEEKIKAIGDPTETALVYFAFDKGLFKDELDNISPRKAEIPFDSERKLMTTINEVDSQLKALTKGAVDVLLPRCSSILKNGEIQPISDQDRENIKQANREMAGNALRVLAGAFRNLDQIPSFLSSEEVEKDLVFVGLVGMIDPPREEVKAAVEKCSQAGIRAVMITGDHRDTAAAIAKELNIIKDDSEVLTGNELDKIGDRDFEKIAANYSVYARVSPEHKVRIVKAWKKKGKIVAMTGDGVNDAPALKTANIGVGMGITGTDVAKGVADMVLSDDNFATIVTAVEEGRKIYSNIRKTIQFLLSANMSEVTALFIATMLNWKILLPIHILWINLVTDTFPALALGMEKAEKDIMKLKPRKSNKSFFAGGIAASIIYQGILQGTITLAVFYLASRMYPEDPRIHITMAFATLGLVQLAHAFNVRSLKKSLFKLGLFTNLYMIGAISISVLLQISVITLPFLNSIFKVVQLSREQWLIVVLASLLIIPLVELEKLIGRIQKEE